MTHQERHSIPAWDKYAYTDDGFLWSCYSWRNRTGWNKISTRPNTHGYNPATLYRVGRDPWHTQVHAVIALAVLGPCPDGHTVDHINRKRWDNRPENLQHLTRVQQLAHLDQRGEKGHNAKLSNADVESMFALSTTGLSQLELGVVFGVSQTQVGRILNGKQWNGATR